jgi:tRNA-dihydrouridine synthase 3
MSAVSRNVAITCKIRTGVMKNKNVAHELIPLFRTSGVDLVILHGRSREQRYTKLADFDYIKKCAQVARENDLTFFGNGDVMSFVDYYEKLETYQLEGIMVGRGALIKPWIFTEIKEKRHYDITSNERLDLMKHFCKFGLEHWGSDQEGINKTRRFLLEWHSFHYRYVPVGLMEVLPQRINDRPPLYYGRNDLETLMASDNVKDWVKLSEMVLGPVDPSFSFVPKHKSNSYEVSG